MKDSFKNRMKLAMDIAKKTQVDLSRETGIGKSAISQYVSGKYEPKQTGVYQIAKALNVNEAWLMGYDVPMERVKSTYADNLVKIKTADLPMLNEVEITFETSIESKKNMKADCCIRVKDDSMRGVRIQKGDVVFIKKQDTARDGDICAVIVDADEGAILRMVFKHPNGVILTAAHVDYKPIAVDQDKVCILGKAIAFQSELIK